MAAKKGEVVTTEDLSTPEIIVKPGDVKYVTVKNPFDGAKTEVPEDIVDALLESGYTKSK